MYKKIFIEADSIAYPRMSGIGHATLEIVKALDKLLDSKPQFQVTIIIPQGTRHIIDGYKLKHIAVKTMPLPQKYINYLLVRTPVLLPIDLWFGRGLYIFPNYKTWYTPFSQSLMFAHDVVYKVFPETVQQKNLKYLKKNFPRWIRRSSKVITISKASAADFKKYFPDQEHKLKVIYLGVDKDQYFSRSKTEITKALKKYNLPQNYFMYVGNIEPRKNIGIMLKAYEEYCAMTENPKALILIGGDGWQNKEIIDEINLMQKRGRQVIRPSRYIHDKDLPKLYSGATALVHIAIHEGFGLSPAQAAACGTPVIASDIPVLREILKKENTLFVDPKNKKAITDALEESTKLGPVQPYVFNTWEQTVQSIVSLTDTME